MLYYLFSAGLSNKVKKKKKKEEREEKEGRKEGRQAGKQAADLKVLYRTPWIHFLEPHKNK